MRYCRLNHNYIKNKKNNARARQYGKDISLKGDYERKEAREQKYGVNNELIIMGGTDRISGNPPQDIEDEKEKISYLYGYYERGSRILVGKFEKGICSPEEQTKFGMSDLIYGVPEEFLNHLKQYPSYMEGRIYKMGISAYNFLMEKGMTIEEYINVMGIIYPEVKEKQFMEGYLSRIKVKKLKRESR